MLRKQGEVKLQSFIPYVKEYENGLVVNPIETTYPVGTPIFKTRQIKSQFRRWVQNRNLFFTGISPDSEIYARLN